MTATSPAAQTTLRTALLSSLTFFDKKVRHVRSATAGLPPPPASITASSSLASFRLCTQTEMRHIIMQLLVKSCTLDPVPTFLVGDFVDLLLPFLTTMVNTSLMQGQLPALQKHAIVTPRLKRSGLDPTLTSPTSGQCRI